MGDSSRVLGDDFRVCIASRDLPELMSQQRLTRELSSRLGYQVKASWDKGQVVWYAPSARSADEIAQVACEMLELEVLARHDIGRYRRAPVRTERWSPRAKVWRDVADKPSADIAADKQAADIAAGKQAADIAAGKQAREHEARQERERQTSVKFGIPYWQVLVKLRSHHDVVALAGHLSAQGWPVHPHRRSLIVGANCEDDAKSLAQALSGDGRAAADTAFGVRRVELYATWTWSTIGFDPGRLRVLRPSRPTWSSPF
jgi:hypothetical protein